jgi:hypothetical protein
MNPAGRVRCNIAPIAKGYSRAAPSSRMRPSRPRASPSIHRSVEHAFSLRPSSNFVSAPHASSNCVWVKFLTSLSTASRKFITAGIGSKEVPRGFLRLSSAGQRRLGWRRS